MTGILSNLVDFERLFMISYRNFVYGLYLVVAISSLNAAQAPQADPDPDAGAGFGYGMRYPGMPFGYGNQIQLSKGMQNIMQQDMIWRMMQKTEREHVAAPAGSPLQAFLGNRLDSLKRHLKLLEAQDGMTAKLGRAIASGLAGTGKEVDEQFEDMLDGAKYGAMMRVAKDCGDVLSKRLQGTSEHVLGGIWDFVIGSMVSAWQATQNFLFHGGHQPFTIKELKGWQDLIKTAFDDVERLVKDGVKDSLRGHDLSLRKNDEDGNDAPQVERKSVWRLLIAGYIRQINYFVSLIDDRLGYYDEDSDKSVIFFATELKELLVTFAGVLNDCATIKDLDTVLESSKWLIPAMRKDICNIMVRLSEQIEPKSYLPIKESSSMLKESSGRKESMGYSDDMYPHPMNG